MSDDIPSTELQPRAETVEEVAPGVRRMLAADNPPVHVRGHGVLYRQAWPGGDRRSGPRRAHIAACSTPCAETVTCIFVTHTHRDHSRRCRGSRWRPEPWSSPKGRTGPRVPCTSAKRRASTRAATPTFVDHALLDGEVVARCELDHRGGRDPGHTANHAGASRSRRPICCSRRSRHGVVDAGGRAAGRLLMSDTASLQSSRAAEPVYLPGHGGACAMRRASSRTHPSPPGARGVHPAPAGQA
jgi:hypothetical protein